MTGGYTPRDLAVLIPLLGRPHHIPPLLASLDATVPGARVILLTTPGNDAEPAAYASGREVVPVRWQPSGDFQRKINVGYRYTTEPLIFVGASDLEFRPGWFEAATARLAPGVGLVGTNDMCNPRVMAGEHATHFLLTREYVDRYGILTAGPDGQPVNQPGVALFEGYRHEFCDTEAVATARARNAWAMALDSLVVHKHPMCGGEDDPIYREQQARMRESWSLFRRRRRLWDPAAPRVLRRTPTGRRPR